MKSVLVVDDSDTFRNELLRYLEAQQLSVYTASDGQQGLQLLRDNSGIDLLITDYNMPTLNGLDMVEQFRREYPTRVLPIFVLTAESSADLKNKAKHLRVRAWIKKPIAKEALLAAIQQVLQL